MVYDLHIWVPVSNAKVSCVGTCTKRNYLLRSSRVGGKILIDKFVDCGGANVGS
jgi:hypothetical protein